MRKRLPVLEIAIVVTLVLGHNVSAEAANRVTRNSYEDSSPHIKGNYVVWQGHIDCDWEIILYDVSTGQCPVRITQNDFDDISPQTDGNYVVWLGFSQPDGGVFLPGGEIFLYDISTGLTTRITSDTNVDSYPQIADGRVVWASHVAGDSVEPGEIFLYEIATGVTVQLTNNALDDHSPRINDQSVVWVRADVTGATSLFIHHIGNGTEPAPDGFVWEDTSQKDGDVKVLTRYDGNDREIFTLNLNLGVYDQITNNNFEDRSPVISGGIIAWLGNKGEASEIYTTGAAPVSADCGSSWDTGCYVDEDREGNGAVDSTGEGGGGGGFCFIGTIGKGFSW
jgi:beta propeller repeat protein